MTLPSSNLDDKTFVKLFDDAKKLIPRFEPEWTDHNTHDPGITLIELFAWLAETQQYYLNRIRNENYLKFLKLLGVRPKQAAQAVADVTFSFAQQPGLDVIVPKGTRLLADQLIFETGESNTVVTAQIKKIISFYAEGWADHTEANRQQGLSYMAFGERAENGSALYLGFSDDLPFPPSRLVSLTFNVFEDYRDAKGNRVTSSSGNRKKVPSGIIEWEYLKRGRNTSGTWAPLKIVKDKTGMLYGNGRLFFLAPGDMAARSINPFPEKCCWIRATVRQEGFELPPRLNRVMLNTVPAVQRETFSEVLTFSATGCKKYSFEATSLALYGCNYVQVIDDNGFWKDWTDFKIEKNITENVITVIFNISGTGKVPRKGRKNMRLISYRPEWTDNGLIGRSSGFPNQQFKVQAVPVDVKNISLQVGRELMAGSPGQLSWEDWLAVDDFDASGPGDHHFVLDPEQGEIIFGDGINGAIPPAPSNKELLNIRLISYCAGGGEEGNVLPGAVNKIIGPVGAEGRLKVENAQPASGGTSKEFLEEAKIRTRRSLRQGFRAVTSQDYERLAGATPGIRVARAKAIPLFKSGLANYPADPVPAAVTVVVVPFSDAVKPVPSSGFVRNVLRHLDRYRLITTELDVKPPDYVEVSVSASIVINSRSNPNNLLSKVKEELKTFLHPLTGGPEGSGWPFGRSIYKSEIFGLLEKVEGVDYIKEVVLNAQGAGIKSDAQGNYSIPPQSLVYSGEHEVEIISPGRVCCGKGGI
ncbi:MAG: Baseplate J-like protein [Pelotomaculum sp. PtaB.Bin104]|nr:MAG: Baseplate J-like protein [Pelotomaculum sp. PtaB.Bin104]